MTENDAPHGAGLARSPADAGSLPRFDQRMALPLVAAAVLPLFMLPGGNYPFVGALVFIASWLIFLVDLMVHVRHLVHYLRTWLGRFDLLVVVLTAPWFLVFGPSESKFVLLIRLARVARVVMATRGAHRLFARLGRVALLAVIVVFLGAAVAYRAEHPTNSGFATYGDALWWAVVTLTTVGYGDIVPHTTAGRIDGVMIMITGVSVLGLLAGSLASFFHLESGSSLPTAQPLDDTDSADELIRKVGELQSEIARLVDEVARRAPPGDGPS